MDIQNPAEFEFSDNSPVLASEPSDRVSSDYKFLSTIDVVDRLKDDGWQTMSVQHIKKRNKSKSKWTHQTIPPRVML